MEIDGSLIILRFNKKCQLALGGENYFQITVGWGENFTAACCRLVTLTRSCWQMRWWKCSLLGRDRGLEGLPQTCIEGDRGNVSKLCVCVCVLGGCTYGVKSELRGSNMP